MLITSANKQLSLTQEIIQKAKEANADRKVYTCDMYPESIPDIVDSDGCLKVPICTSEDYVETIFSICLGYDISHIITMTEREFIILSANKDMFGRYGVQVFDGRRKMLCPAERAEIAEIVIANTNSPDDTDRTDGIASLEIKQKSDSKSFKNEHE